MTLFSDTDTRKNQVKVALVGTFLPRKCGLATFTTDVRSHIAEHQVDIDFDVYAIDAPDAPEVYGVDVAGVIRAGHVQDFERAADRINHSAADVLWVQHEYGIFGGEDGDCICNLVDRVAAPVVLTLHTVLTNPSENQRRILHHLVARASRVMVMSHYARDILIAHYGAHAESVLVIPHGAPDRPFGREEAFKAALGHQGKAVLMTFGLLGRGKGLERVIEALPAILARHPDTVYRIVGATHPGLVAHEGEAYRQELQELAARLGVGENIVWDNRFLDNEDLLDQLEACDIFITPYPNLQQSTSGTLAYAVALGKAIISTPYVHAQELLANGTGLLVEPDCSSAIADSVNALLDDPALLGATKQRAYAKGRETIWPSFAKACAMMVRGVVARHDVPTPAVQREPSIAGVIGMSDGTGMFQHSIGIVPDRRHGYCLDDNVRALMLMNVARGVSPAERLRWSMIYASFIQYAWNEDEGCFRNFMSFDRRWLEECGSEDSNGRTLWALGHTIEYASDPHLREWALDWFDKAYGRFTADATPRTLSFAMLGAAAVLRARRSHTGASALLLRGAGVLASLLNRARRPDWHWFEAFLGYDNPRICQALIEAGMLHRRQDWVNGGIETLEWIGARQTGERGWFRPVGSETFGKDYTMLPFDQQPLEAWAAVDAARTAFLATGESAWLVRARAAYAWYFGENDRGIALADIGSGRCQDGLTPRGVNRNCGAESILAFQLAHWAVNDLFDMASPGKAERLNLDSNGVQPASHPRH